MAWVLRSTRKGLVWNEKVQRKTGWLHYLENCRGKGIRPSIDERKLMSATAWMDDEVKRSKESFGLTIIFIWLKKKVHTRHMCSKIGVWQSFFFFFSLKVNVTLHKMLPLEGEEKKNCSQRAWLRVCSWVFFIFSLRENWDGVAV